MFSVLAFFVIYFTQWELFGRSNKEFADFPPESLSSVALNVAISFSTIFVMSLATYCTSKGAQLTCSLSACSISLIAAASNILTSLELSPISINTQPRPTVIIHAKWAELMVNTPLLVFVLGHVTQANPTCVFSAMAIQFLATFFWYLSALAPSFLSCAFCAIMGSFLLVFVCSCIFLLSITLSHHRFVLQCCRKIHTSVLNQTLIKALGISTLILFLGTPFMYVLYVTGILSTRKFLLGMSGFGLTTRTLFLVILKATHIGGETKRMEAVVEDLKIDNALQTKFLRFVYHEIRNPFNSIMLGLSHLEEEEPLLPYRELLVMLRRSANAMNRVIGDVVELTQARGLQLVLESVCVKTVLASALETFSDFISRKCIDVKQEISKHIPLGLLTDSEKLKKVFEVLISNAVKFSPLGATVIVSLEDMDTSSGFCSLIFSVTDSGPGISEHMIPLIFQPFEEVRPGDFSDDDNRGSGLGLCFAKHLVDLMSGKLSFTTSSDRGSTFTLELRLEIIQREDSAVSSWNKFITPRRVHSRESRELQVTYESNRPPSKGHSMSSKTSGPRSGGLSTSGSSRVKVVPQNLLFTKSIDRSGQIKPLGLSARAGKRMSLLVLQRGISSPFYPRSRHASNEASESVDKNQEGLSTYKYGEHMNIRPLSTQLSCEVLEVRRQSSFNALPRLEPVEDKSFHSCSVVSQHISQENSDTTAADGTPFQCTQTDSALSHLVKDGVDEKLRGYRRLDSLAPLIPHGKHHRGSSEDLEMATRSQHLKLYGEKTHVEQLRQQDLVNTARKSARCVSFESREGSERRNLRGSLPSARECAPNTSRQQPSLLKACSFGQDTKLMEVFSGPPYKIVPDEKDQVKQAQVLVVDDVKSNQRLVCMILEKAGYVCDTASDGHEAVTMARKHQYQLIIMDNVMPVMDGMEATRRILSFDQHVAIVALTGNVLQKDQQEFMQAGVRFVIEKPANKAQLLKACNQFVR